MVGSAPWSCPGVLTPLQERVARVVGSLQEAHEFALAGGAALIVRGDVDRITRDLDYFGPSQRQVDELVPAVHSALEAEGLAVIAVRTAPGFARLEVSSGAEKFEIVRPPVVRSTSCESPPASVGGLDHPGLQEARDLGPDLLPLATALRGSEGGRSAPAENCSSRRTRAYLNVYAHFVPDPNVRWRTPSEKFSMLQSNPSRTADGWWPVCRAWPG
jgi:hypothetical protein